MEDEEMKYCKICLVTDCKMFSSPSISQAYSQLVQVAFCADNKLYVCYECKHLLRKCQEFRYKCMTALNVLSSIHMDHSKIPTRYVRGIDRTHFKLQSKISRSSMLVVCNSNQQMVIPETNLDSDIEIDTSPDALEDDKSETKFAIDVEGKDPCSDLDIKIEIETNPDTLEDDKHEVKFNIDAEDVFYDVETNDTDYPKEIIQSSHAPNNIVPEIKCEQKCQLKSKKTREKVPKKIKTLKCFTKKRNLVLPPLSASSILSKTPSKNMMKMFEEYAIVHVMTPSEAKKEILLKKESRYYKTALHTCELCYKGFSTESSFNEHMKHHSPDKGTLECEICHLFFSNRRQLTHHVEGCHKYKISCIFCSYVCFSPTQAKSHNSAIHKGKTYTCELCNLRFRYLPSIISHKRVKHPELVCEYCGNMFASISRLKLHKYRAHRQDSKKLLGPKCKECNVQFATETAWKRHLVLSSKHTVSNGCEECGEVFLTADELKSHAKEHPQRLVKAQLNKTAVCELCDIQMDTYYEYKTHMKSAHPNTTDAEISRRLVEEDDTQYICEVCGKGFKNCLLLKYHTNKHTGELPFECDQCDKKYANPSSLFAHKTCHHSGAPRFTCDACQKVFHFKYTLRKHIIMNCATKKNTTNKHTGELPFECDQCDKKYANPSSLSLHKTYHHSGAPRFTCDVCQKGFHFKCTLRKHIMVHLGVRRFKCDICKKSFRHQCEVKTHMEYVHFKKTLAETR